MQEEKIGSKDEITVDKEEIELEITEDMILTTSDLLEIQELLVQLAHLAKEQRSDQRDVDQNERLEALAESQFVNQKTIRTKKAEWKNIKSTITMVR